MWCQEDLCQDLWEPYKPLSLLSCQCLEMNLPKQWKHVGIWTNVYSLYMLYKTQEGKKTPLRVKDEVHFIVYTATLLPKLG